MINDVITVSIIVSTMRWWSSWGSI